MVSVDVFMCRLVGRVTYLMLLHVYHTPLSAAAADAADAAAVPGIDDRHCF